MITTLDGLFVVTAILIVAVWLSRRSLLRCAAGGEETRKGSIAELLKFLVSHGRIMSRRGVGLAHMILFWGVVIPLLAALAAQFDLHLHATAAALVSLLLDLLGVGALASTVFLLGRRMKQRRDEGPGRTLAPMIALLFVILTGFLAEGARLSILQTGSTWSSPVGSALAAVLPGSPLLLQTAFRAHFFGFLCLVALLPFSFAGHLVWGALNVFYKRQDPPGALRPASFHGDYAGAGRVQDFSWKQLLDVDACVACGRCEEVCPAAVSGKPLSPRRLMGKLREQLDQTEGKSGDGSPRFRKAPVGCVSLHPPDSPKAFHVSSGVPKEHEELISLEEAVGDGELWSCTTCMACVEHCPVYAEPLDKIVELRRYRLMEGGRLPAEGKPVLRNLELFGDPYGRGPAYRGEWALDHDLQGAADSAQVLLWVGCAGAFHPRGREIAGAMVKILKAARVPFGILSRKEMCCGDPARRLGEENLFLRLAAKNLEAIRACGAGRIVTFCPHCYNVLKNEYRALGLDLEVVHATELVADLIRRGAITPRYPLQGKMTLHDPCYLGRGNGIYAPLREISRSIPGAQLVELPRNRAQGLCCGGGGGLMWLHERDGRRINAMRAEEATASGADILGTACPYCVTMLEDGLGSSDAGGKVRVMDMVEIIADAIG